MELGGEGGEGWLNSLSYTNQGMVDIGQGDHQMLKFCGGTFIWDLFIYLFRNQFNLFLASSIQVQP